ncbi:MAG: hypothetical protein ACTSRP_07415 [Candidatus Helarchaeota archaeon]
MNINVNAYGTNIQNATIIDEGITIERIEEYSYYFYYKTYCSSNVYQIFVSIDISTSMTIYNLYLEILDGETMLSINSTQKTFGMANMEHIEIRCNITKPSWYYIMISTIPSYIVPFTITISLVEYEYSEDSEGSNDDNEGQIEDTKVPSFSFYFIIVTLLFLILINYRKVIKK